MTPVGALTITGTLGAAGLRDRQGTGRRVGGRGDHRSAGRLGAAARRVRADRIAAPVRRWCRWRLFRISGAGPRRTALTVLFGAVAVGVPFVLTLYAQQVLGYSALSSSAFSSVVLAWVAVTIGAISVPRGLVGKAGFRPVAVTGAVLLAGGSVVLTQVTPTWAG